MIDSIFGICELLRPILFFALLGYVPMKFGIGFDVAGKPPSTEEVRVSRDSQLQRLNSVGIFNALLSPFRLLAISYFAMWLLIDKYLAFIVVLFVFTFLPLYFK